MNVVVIDGQGGSLGKTLIKRLRQALPNQTIIAVGTNSMATSAMLKAGASVGATGENPIITVSASADIILGPLGILIANSLLGEITPAMAEAVGKSKAKKILIPISKCNCIIAGSQELSLSEYIDIAVSIVLKYIEQPVSAN